jgi:hypothetical protein
MTVFSGRCGCRRMRIAGEDGNRRKRILDHR